MNAAMHEQLEQYLHALKRDECYRAERVLKESPHEKTELVYFVGLNGEEQGPFIRKTFSTEDGLGKAYERIFHLQEQGARFKYIPRVLECYSTGEQSVVVMEYIEGETLAEVVYRSDPSPELALRVMPSLCDAVSELHESFTPPIIHRDLKPSNVMISPQGLSIIDFGIARTYREDADADTQRFGTRCYAPPEQFGYGQTTVASDIYALGMIAAYCLTERTPTPHDVETGFADAAIPEALRPVLVRATQFDPKARYASAREFRADFERAMQGRTEQPAESLPSPAGAAAAETHETLPAGAPSPEGSTPFAQATRTVPSTPGATTARTPLVERLPQTAGIIWDIVLVGIWVLFIVASCDLIAHPKGSMATYSFAGRCVACLGMFGLGGAAIVWVLADKRHLRARVPWLARLSRRAEIAICITFAIVITFVSVGIALVI